MLPTPHDKHNNRPVSRTEQQDARGATAAGGWGRGVSKIVVVLVTAFMVAFGVAPAPASAASADGLENRSRARAVIEVKSPQPGEVIQYGYRGAPPSPEHIAALQEYETAKYYKNKFERTHANNQDAVARCQAVDEALDRVAGVAAVDGVFGGGEGSPIAKLARKAGYVGTASWVVCEQIKFFAAQNERLMHEYQGKHDRALAHLRTFPPLGDPRCEWE